MQYFGGKVRVAKDLSKFINQEYLEGNNTPFVDLFCGSCNVLVKINKDREIIANDKHFYLIEMWKELQNGWKPPMECTRKQYEIVRDRVDVKPHVSGFIGFGCSF
ncbi:MAG: DNA adenine methylase, partial [Cetobacterium sp.]